MVGDLDVLVAENAYPAAPAALERGGAEVATAMCALWMIAAAASPNHPIQRGIAAFNARFTKAARREAAALAAFCNGQFEQGARAERTIQLFDGPALARSAAGHGRRLIAGAPDACA